MSIEDPRERLIVALDLPDAGAARALVEQLGDEIVWYKIGYELAYGGGLSLVEELARRGKKVFLDLKLLDIPNTVEAGVRSAARLGAGMLTVHAYPHAMRAARAAAGQNGPTILGVTVLTALDDGDLAEAGYAARAEELVLTRARQAAEIGIGGVVASPREASRIRAAIGPQMAVVTPGIRPAAHRGGDDQKRVATPAEAIAAGASHLVVGRPIAAAEDPLRAARAILSEIASAGESGSPGPVRNDPR